MSYEDETDYSSSTFRCIDPIQNFKLKVVLQSAKSRFIPVPHFETEKKDNTSDTIENEENVTDREEYVFSWQEKIFSNSEIAKYSNTFNCSTKLHEKYHEEVTKITENANRKLFSYVDADNFKPNDDYINPVVGSKYHVTLLSQKMDKLNIAGSSVKNFKNVSINKVVNYSPNDDFKMKNHFMSSSCQKMYIMADLKDKPCDDVKKAENNDQEYILCVLIYDSTNKVLKMTPSFSKEVNGRPYSVGISDHYSKNAYHYWLHHASSKITDQDMIQEKKMMNKILQRQMDLRMLQIGNDFNGQPADRLGVTVLGEILTAQNFEYDRILVHYVINLNSGWCSSNPESLTGVTHTARTNSYGVAHFCHLFDVDLIFYLEHLEDFSAYQPEIYFEVLSMDKWKIYRNEGYGYVSLPRKPGMHILNVPCWRGTDNSIKSKLERFFVGGGEILEDISYVGAGAKNESRRLMSRFGFKTVPTGSLDIKLNIIHQSEAFKPGQKVTSHIDRDLFGRDEAGALMENVNAVLAAFMQAKEKLLKAKEGLDAGSD